MAATRLIALHRNKGRTAAQCLRARTDYVKNPAKTENGMLVTGYECSPDNVDLEFALSRKEYLDLTGRLRPDEVIAYQLRQSFKPGEITPEEANKVGYETAMRFLKGAHAFIVATHTDKHHIHNHVIFDAVSLDGDRKFRNFLGSGRAFARLSDQICLEHRLSVIAHPQDHGGQSYNKWLGDKAKPSARDRLRAAIDEAMEKKPDSMEALIHLLQEAGWEVKRGKQPAFRAPDGKRFTRLDTLGEEYSEDVLRAVIKGGRQHKPGKKKYGSEGRLDLLKDIEQMMKSGKGPRYQQWAKVFNSKQMAKAYAYMSRQGIETWEELKTKSDEANRHFKEVSDGIQSAETRMHEIEAQRKSIINYMKTKEVFAAWKQSGWSKKFEEEHREALQIHRAAKQAFEAFPGKKVPSLKALSEEYGQLREQHDHLYSEYKEAKKAMSELMIVRENVERMSPEERESKAKEEKRKSKSEQR